MIINKGLFRAYHVSDFVLELYLIFFSCQQSCDRGAAMIISMLLKKKGKIAKIK